MPLGTLDKGLGCSLRPTSEPELDLGTCPSSNYVERETKQGEPKSGFKCLEEPQLQAGPAGPADRTAPPTPHQAIGCPTALYRALGQTGSRP